MAQSSVYALIVVPLALSLGCGGSLSRFPGVSVEPGDRVTELTLNAAPCSEPEAQLQWLEVSGAQLEGPTSLLVRATHPACPTTELRACGDATVINTYPGIWEVRLEAHGADDTRCAGTRTTVLRVDLSSNPVASSGDLDYVGGVHSASSSTEGERTQDAVCIDVRMVPR